MNKQNSTDKPERNSYTAEETCLPITRRSVLKNAGALGVSGTFLATASESVEAHDVPDHLAETPPMGWNSWNTFGCNINAELIKETADMIVESGMKEVGYEYVNIDDCWMAETRGPDGNLQPHPERFPNGIKPVADYVHQKGLKLGIYESAGTVTCAGYPGSLLHEEQDAQKFAEWGVDYLKYDNCGDHLGYSPKTRYQRMWNALDATDRDIVKSQCSWGVYKSWKTWAKDIGSNLWRTTFDITDAWDTGKEYGESENRMGIINILNYYDAHNLYKYAKPGHWNDLDMLEVGNPGLSVRESRAHFSLWCILNAPLLAGNDLRGMSDEESEILTNREVIAINQDWAGCPGTKRKDTGDQEVWAKPLSNGDVAVCLLNRGDSASTISIDIGEFDLPNADAYILRDLWAKTEVATAERISASVPSHDVAFYRVRSGTPNEAPPATTLSFDTNDVITINGETTVTTSLTNNGRIAIQDVNLSLEAPDGWDAIAKTSRTHHTVPPSKSVETTWEITAPDEVTSGWYEFTATATYTHGKTTYRTSSSTSLSVLPAPPTSDTYLSEHPWVSATIGWGEIGLNESVENNPITISGTTYEKGIGTHAKSKITYYLGGDMSRFIADVGVDDETDDHGSVRFLIVGDNETLAETEVLTGSEDATHLDVDISGVEMLNLIVTDGGDGIDYDHADWAIAKVFE